VLTKAPTSRWKLARLEASFNRGCGGKKKSRFHRRSIRVRLAENHGGATRETTVRHFLVPFILIGVVGLAGAAAARDVHTQKYSMDELKSACEKAGGKFSQGGGLYGCGTDCHGGPGTACIVTCGEGKRCTAQLMGGRRFRNLAQALGAAKGSPR
jgi:hypothetical protein